MANIKNHLNNIKNALFGQEVRGSIHDGIDAINKEVEGTTEKQNKLGEQFKNLVINEGNSNAEVAASRGSHDWLPDRLDNFDSQLEHIRNLIVNVKDYGAKGDGVTNDAQAITNAIKAVPNGGTLIFPKCDEYYLVDYFDEGQYGNPLFLINKPMTIIGENKSLIKIPDQSKLWHKGGRTDLFRIVKSDVRIDGLQIDGNSRNNFTVEGKKVIYYATEDDACYPTGTSLINYQIDLTAENADRTIYNAVVENCELMDSSSSTVSMTGGLESMTEPMNSSMRDNIIFKPIIRGNKVKWGQRSILNFIHGVVGGIIEDNEGTDIYYYLCRAYLQVIDSSIFNNRIFINTTVDDGAHYESIIDGVPRTPVNTGIRIGHENRGVGTVCNMYVENNIINCFGNHEWKVDVCIIVGKGVDNFTIRNNIINTSTTSQAIDIRELSGNGVIKGNNITYCGEQDRIFQAIRIRENSNHIVVAENMVKATKNSINRGIYCGVSASNIELSNNTIFDNGNAVNPIFFHGSADNIYLYDNKYQGQLLNELNLTIPETNISIQNSSNYSMGDTRVRGEYFLGYNVGSTTSTSTFFYIVLERYSTKEDTHNGFTFGTLYGCRGDANAREFKIDIMSHGAGGEHIAHIDYVAGARSVPKLVKLNYNNIDYLAIKIGDGTNQTDTRYFNTFFTGQHSSEGESLFTVKSTDKFIEYEYTNIPNGGWICGNSQS